VGSKDDGLARRLTLPHALVTAHQTFFPREALATMGEMPLASVPAFAQGEPLAHEVRAVQVLRMPPPP
jgi:D-lactate dehydrogenase